MQQSCIDYFAQKSTLKASFQVRFSVQRVHIFLRCEPFDTPVIAVIHGDNHMKNREHMLKKILWVLVIAAILVPVVYIMYHHLGLVDGLDFGAGAYYYADIPEFSKYVNGSAYISNVPSWVLILLFLAWGALMYRFWIWIEKKGKHSDGE
jgi:hypothetical protein